MTRPLPARVHHREEARALYPELFERLTSRLYDSDPLMDAFVQAHPHDAVATLDRALRHGLSAVARPRQSLVALVQEAEQALAGQDLAVIDRGGSLLLRSGVLGSVALSFKSLIHGYAAPAGNKPLAFSGRLTQKAARRLNETGRFLQAVVLPGGMHRFGDGFAITMKVRLMHTKVRLMLQDAPGWDMDRWALPVNQHDQVATILLFSSVLIDGLRQCGMCMQPDEQEEYMALWRWVGHVIGVAPDLLPHSVDEARRMEQMIFLTQGEPDEDSRGLAQALLAIPRKERSVQVNPRLVEMQIHVRHGLCRAFVGKKLADALGVEDGPAQHVLPQLQRVLTATAPVRSRIPGYDQLHRWSGKRFWNGLIERVLDNQPATFAPPGALSGRPAA